MPLITAPPLSLNNIVPFAEAVATVPPPIALGIGAGLAVGAIIATAAAAADLAQALSDLEKAKANGEAIRQRPVGTGEKREPIPSPTTGGQTAGRLYTVSVAYVQAGYPEGSPYAPTVVRYPQQRGAIGGLSFLDGDWSLTTGDGVQFILRENAQIKKGDIPRIVKVVPDDGVAEIPPPPTLDDPVPSGYNGTRPKTRKPVDQGTRAALGLGSTPKKPPVEKGARAALGLGSTPAREPNTGLAPPPPSRKKAPDPTPPLPPPETKPKKPIIPDKDPNEKDKTPPFIPKPPATPDDINKSLIGLGAIITLIASNTSPEALKNAAKTGSCESLQSPSCTKDVEDRIRNPLSSKLDANAIANDIALKGIAANQFNQNAILAALQAASKVISETVSMIANNAIVQQTISLTSLALNVHNGLMLSNSLGKTLGSIVDTVFSLRDLQFTNQAGSKVGATKAFQNKIDSFLISIIGLQNFTELTTNFKVANRIYQSSTNLLNKV